MIVWFLRQNLDVKGICRPLMWIFGSSGFGMCSFAILAQSSGVGAYQGSTTETRSLQPLQ